MAYHAAKLHFFCQKKDVQIGCNNFFPTIRLSWKRAWYKQQENPKFILKVFSFCVHLPHEKWAWERFSLLGNEWIQLLISVQVLACRKPSGRLCQLDERFCLVILRHLSRPFINTLGNYMLLDFYSSTSQSFEGKQNSIAWSNIWMSSADICARYLRGIPETFVGCPIFLSNSIILRNY